MLGALGGLVGALEGLLIARPVVDRIGGALTDVIGTDIAFHPAPGAVPFAIAGAVVAGACAGFVPARRIATIDPADALRPGGTPAQGGTARPWAPRPTIAGLTLAAASLVALIAGPTAIATSATAGVAIGPIVASYGLAGPTAAIAARFLRRLGGLPAISAAGIARHPQRIWATSTALALGVALAITVGGGAANQRTFTAGQFDSLRGTDLWVSATPAEDLTHDLRLPDDTPTRLAAVPGVRSIGTDTLTYLTVDSKRVIAVGLDGTSSFPLLQAANPAKQQDVLAGNGAIVSHQYAKTFDLDVGDTMTLPGPVEVSVLQVVESLALAEHGMFVVADRTLREIAPAVSGVNSVEVGLEPDTDREVAARTIRRALAESAHPLVIQTGDEAYNASIRTLDQLYDTTDGMLIVVVLIGGLAVLNSVFASVLERRRELGILRAIGSSPGQTTRIIGIEVATIAVIGLTMGLVLGGLLHWAGTTYAAAATPLPVDYRFAPAATLFALAAGAIAVALGAIIPIRAAHRVDILEAIAWE